MKDKINEMLKEYHDNLGANSDTSGEYCYNHGAIAALERLLKLDSKEVLKGVARDAAQQMEGPGVYKELLAEFDEGVIKGIWATYPNTLDAAWVLGVNRGTLFKKRTAAGMYIRRRTPKTPNGGCK